jgi:hypothetical protein
MLFCSSTTTTTLFFNWMVLPFILLTVHDSLNVNFTGKWIGIGESLHGPLILLILCICFLWGYMKDQLHSQRVNMLDELEAWITAAIANVTKDMLQLVWQEVGCMQSYRVLNMKNFELLHLCVYIKKKV